MSTIALFGGSGYLGRRLAQRLIAAGDTVRVAVRDAERARGALRASGLERVTVYRADVRDRGEIARAVAGADAVVNAVSAYVEARGVTFEGVHQRGAEAVAREAAVAGVVRHVLVSGIGADAGSSSAYIRARGRGEQLVTHAFPGTTIVRPSAMFGPGDALISTIAGLARVLPALPLIGAGRTHLQPVFVMDVAEAIARILANPETTGCTYELGGPTVYTLRELYTLTLRLLGSRRVLVPVPFALAGLVARVSEWLPNPPLTTGQVDLLKMDNVVSNALPGLPELGIAPKALAQIAPAILHSTHPDNCGHT
ncbi:MAG TPA: complex I NDUFA9 subunit family protein [Steroidobacteraceae bacterium]|jgi:NADH dehydrogenase|nr:complex I NDUFA9 subunit family protein [Steroidobacteraceae bacterium]